MWLGVLSAGENQNAAPQATVSGPQSAGGGEMTTGLFAMADSPILA